MNTEEKAQYEKDIAEEEAVQYPPLSKRAIRKLEKVLAIFKKDPRKLDMHDWARVYDKTVKGEDGKPLYNPRDVRGDFNSCGTVGCLAGWVCLTNVPGLKKELRADAKDRSENVGFAEFSRLDASETVDQDPSGTAAEILGLTPKQGNKLFMPFDNGWGENWPIKFQKMYENAKTPAGRVAATVKRVKHFIKTNGKE